MNNKKIRVVAEKAARILRENPKLTYRQAIAKAKEGLEHEKWIRWRKLISGTLLKEYIQISILRG